MATKRQTRRPAPPSPAAEPISQEEGVVTVTFHARHTTPYPRYRRCGLVFNRHLEEFTTTGAVAERLANDSHLDIVGLSTSGDGDGDPNASGGGGSEDEAATGEQEREGS